MVTPKANSNYHRHHPQEKQINLLHLAVLCHNSISYLNNSPSFNAFIRTQFGSWPKKVAHTTDDRIPANSFIFGALRLSVYLFLVPNCMQLNE